MPIIENVIDVEFLLAGDDKGCTLKYLDPYTGKEKKMTFDIESLSFQTPVKSHGHTEGFFFKPEKPLACWIEPRLGEDMRCDTMEAMEREHWHDKEQRAAHSDLAFDGTGQDEERY